MEIKNLIKNKKGASVQSILLTVVIGLFVLIGLYQFISENENQANIDPDPRFANAFSNLSASQKSIETFASNMKNLSQSVREGDPTDFGYYGFKGILSLMILPFNLIDIIGGIISEVSGLNDIIPPIVINTILLTITIILLFAGISFLTNRGKDQT